MRGPRRSQRVQASKPKEESSRLSGKKKPNALDPRGSQPEQAPKPATESLRFTIRKKPNTRGQWTEEVMQNAIDTIKSGKLSIRKASKSFSIPASSISDWMYGKTKKKRHGFDPYLTKVEESELKTWCFTMQERAFSVTLPILKNTVRDIVRHYPRQHPFKNDRPGQRWWKCFKSRHPEVVLRIGEGLELKRCMGLNKIVCGQFYNNLTSVITAQGYEASRIWNMDKSGVQAMGRNNTLKVVAKKGSRNVNVLTCDSKEWLTVLVCISAIGTFIPHYFIFKGTYLLQDYVEFCGPGAAMNVQENGWVTNEIFCDWLNHFKLNVPGGVSKDYKHLLVLDGHCSHVSARALDSCLKMGLDVITIPSHSSHHMQPLDVSCFKPFKQYLQEDKATMALQNPNWGNGVMLKPTLGQMAASALNRALKPSTILAGFKTTGIFPVDPTAMDKHYGPSIPHLNSLSLPSHVKDEEVQQAISSEDGDIDEEVLHENVDEVINQIIQDLLQEEDINEILCEEDSIDVSNEAQIAVHDSVVWPLDDPNPVTIRATDFQLLIEGQCLTDTVVDFYLKYQEKKHHCIKGLHFFNSFFFRKLVIIHKQDATNGFEKIARWLKDTNIFQCDYIFLPILLSGHWSMLVIYNLGSLTVKPSLLHLNSIKSTTHLDLHEHNKFFLSSEWERQNSMTTLKIPKKVLLDLTIQVIDPENNGTDCGIYLIKSVDIFLDTIVEGLSLGQNSEYTESELGTSECRISRYRRKCQANEYKQTILMLQGGSIFSSIVEDKCNGLESGVEALSSILKVPSFPKYSRKPKNPKRLNPHGKCLTSEEFTKNRLKAAKEEEDKFNEKEEKKQKRAELAKSKREAKIQVQIEKKRLASEHKMKKFLEPPSFLVKKRATFIVPLVKPEMHG